MFDFYTIKLQVNFHSYVFPLNFLYRTHVKYKFYNITAQFSPGVNGRNSAVSIWVYEIKYFQSKFIPRFVHPAKNQRAKDVYFIAFAV